MKPLRKPLPNLLNFDWDSLKAKLDACNPNSGEFYMIVINRGQDDEFRTRFMSHKEALDTVNLAIEKKKLHFPITL